MGEGPGEGVNRTSHLTRFGHALVIAFHLACPFRTNTNKFSGDRSLDNIELLRDVGDPVLVYVVPDDVTAGLRAVGL